uniref:CCHC-type domain-containing protein n=1 Tax=Tanacetum cinerariifolium TaxID=118510 RepID=A0A699K6P1_TANCI|nr:hypothetical protein [Tanacetum cinerariifolium]
MIFDPDGVVNVNGTVKQILEQLSKMNKSNKKQYIADVKVMNYLLEAITNHVYNSVDACKNAKETWERIRRLMFESDVTRHVRHSRLTGGFDKFAAKERESLESVYERLTMLVNIIDRNNVRTISVSINTKFLNCLQPEWSKYVTMVHHNKTGETISYDMLKENVQCYSCNEKGHYARDCQKPRVRDVKYFREQMLLAMKDEAISNLNNEENDVMLDTSYGEETIEELTAACMLMARI